MGKKRVLESEQQSILDNHEDSLNSVHGFKQTGNSMVGIDKKRTKGKK